MLIVTPFTPAVEKRDNPSSSAISSVVIVGVWRRGVRVGRLLPHARFTGIQTPPLPMVQGRSSPVLTFASSKAVLE